MYYYTSGITLFQAYNPAVGQSNTYEVYLKRYKDHVNKILHLNKLEAHFTYRTMHCIYLVINSFLRFFRLRTTYTNHSFKQCRNRYYNKQ